MLFNKIVGQEPLKDILRSTALAARVPHSQMFCGDAGHGGLPLAIAYAQYLMCPHRTETEACGECPTCYKVSRLEHPDLHFIFPVNDAKSGSADKPIADNYIEQWRALVLATDGYFDRQQWYQTIGIENKQGIIRREQASDLIAKMSLKSYEGGDKIVVLWLPETMRQEAANALLKLVEEPPQGTVFLFACEDVTLVMDTILSRTQQYQVPPLPSDIIASELVARQNMEPQKAQAVAHSAAGSWIAALEQGAHDAVATQNYDLFVELMRKAYGSQFLDLFDWVERMTAQGREAQRSFCGESIDMLRNCYMVGIGMSQLSYLTPAQRAFADKFAPFVNHRTMEPFVAEFERLSRELKGNGNPKILFTHFALTLCKIIKK